MVIISGTKTNGEYFEKEFSDDAEEIEIVYQNIATVDITPLEKCKNLKQLNLSTNSIKTIDLFPLRHCS
ncbi:MAG: hypothetical protein ACTSXA_14160, partial [Candidatus Heimdallarchaeota archaeon]